VRGFGRLQFLTEHEAQTLAAVAELIYPTTPDGPGAIEIGVVEFIDAQLAGPWGRGERLYRSGPFHSPPHEGHGWQLAMTPAEAYRYGLAALDRIGAEGPGRFLDRDPADQVAVLTALRSQATPPFDAISSGDFFTLVRQNVIEGLFSDPLYGGNRNMAGWRWIGFPGDPAAYGNPYPSRISAHGTTYEVDPRPIES
jgi:gluconate 2-dehydrogenase gamma chain